MGICLTSLYVNSVQVVGSCSSVVLKKNLNLDATVAGERLVRQELTQATKEDTTNLCPLIA